MTKQSFKIIAVLIALLIGSAPAYAVKDFYIKNNTQSYFYVNGTSGNIGIGSTAPGQILDVNGTVRATGLTMTGQSPASGYVLTATDSTGDMTWTAAGQAGGWTTSGNNVYETSGGNVGIGTTIVNQAALTVMNGNVGIGTWAPTSALTVNGTITAPTLTSSGTLTLSSNSINGLTVNTSGGVSLVQGCNAVNASVNCSNGTLYVSGYGAGTNRVTLNVAAESGQTYNIAQIENQASSTTFAVTPSGNVGIGSNITPVSQLAIAGNVGIGTNSSSAFTNTTAPNGGMIVQGNVGIGSLSPGQMLDVTGTVRATGLTMTGQSPTSGYVLTATDSTGDMTWTAAGQAGGWTTSGNNVYETSSGNVGIGTTSTQGALVVTNGNVGVGTWSPTGLLDINRKFNVFSSGNVGIGSVSPGQLLDVQGTVRSTGLTMTGQSPTSGYVLTATDSTGDMTWTAAGQSSGWTTSGNNVYETSSGNVGIGTSTAQGALVVTNGNVGIGTWVPGSPLSVIGNVGFTGQLLPSIAYSVSTPAYSSSSSPTSGMTFSSGGAYFSVGGTSKGAIDTNGIAVTNNLTLGWAPGAADLTGPDTAFSRLSTGVVGVGVGTFGNYSGVLVATNVGIGTFNVSNGALIVTGGNVGVGTWVPTGLLDINRKFNVFSSGNVGIGSVLPGQLLDVTGTVRATGLTMTGQSPTSGYVLTATDSTGDMTWSSAGQSSGWTTSGNNVYETSGGNVGIGTTIVNQAALTVMNGNVGIGTWAPGSLLQVNGSSQNVYITSGGNLGIGTASPSQPFRVVGNVGIQLTGGTALFDSGGSSSQRLRILGPLGGGGAAGIELWGRSDGSLPEVTINGGSSVLSDNGTLIQSPNTSTLSLGVSGNVGIGTAVDNYVVFTSAGNIPAAGQMIVEGNVGLGTFSPFGGQLIVSTTKGNVGIGSLTPGQALDVTGTVRATGLTMMGQSPTSGYVLMATDSTGDTTWTSPGNSSGWTISGNNIYETNSAGNVGIGVSTPSAALQVNGGILASGSGNSYFSTGNLGVGTTTPQAAFVVTDGNVGIGTWTANSGLQIGQSFSVYRVGASGNVNPTAGQTIIGVTSTSSAYTVTLATADTVAGRIIIIKDESGGAATNNITINTQSGQKIDGQSSVTISANYGVLRVYSDGSNWFTF